MIDSDRFGRLEEENKPLPQNVRDAIHRLNRFTHLEIGRTGAALTSPLAPTSLENRKLCVNCNQVNESTRDICWACAKPMTVAMPPKPAPEQPVGILLNGVTYLSTDPQLPLDIQELMKRIRVEGYSEHVIEKWKTWKEQRDGLRPPAPRVKGTPSPVELVDGRYVDVLKIDGVIYKSDDSNLPPEVQEIFQFVEAQGVTPALMQHLRLYGTKVRYRPISTPLPSDGDQSFWKSIQHCLGYSEGA